MVGCWRSVLNLALGYSHGVLSTAPCSLFTAAERVAQGTATRLLSLVERSDDVLSDIYRKAKTSEPWTPFPFQNAEYSDREWPQWEQGIDGAKTLAEEELQAAWNGTRKAFKALGTTWSLLDLATSMFPPLVHPCGTQVFASSDVGPALMVGSSIPCLEL